MFFREFLTASAEALTALSKAQREAAGDAPIRRVFQALRIAVNDEFNALNTDRQLYAIRTVCKAMEKVEQKKSMLYFSGGLTRQGIENQASMRAATNAAVRANMAIYSVDSRGLQALPPVGDASKGSLRGTAAYSGGAMQSQLDANFGSHRF